MLNSRTPLWLGHCRAGAQPAPRAARRLMLAWMGGVAPLWLLSPAVQAQQVPPQPAVQVAPAASAVPAASGAAATQAPAVPLAVPPVAPSAQAGEAGTLPEVQVRSAAGGSSLQALPASASIVDGADLREAQLQVNLSEGLSGVPGLQVRNRQNMAQDLQLSVRGHGARSTFGMRGVRLYVDGIPATMPDGQGSLSHIDIGSIERVEVLRGPYSALFGNSAGGVISVFSETPEGRPVLSGGFSVGSDGQKRISAKAAGSEQGVSYVLSTSRYLSDGWRDHSEANRTLANAKISTDVGSDARLTFVANTLRSRANDPQGLTWAQWQANPRRASYRADNGEAVAEGFNTRKTLRQTQVGLTFDKRLSAAHSLSLSVYGGRRSMTQYQSIPVNVQAAAGHAGGVIDMARDYAGLDARWHGEFRQAPVPVTVTAGLSFDTMTEDRQGYENFVGSGASRQLGVMGALRRDEVNRVRNLDPYVQAAWQLAPQWQLDTGLRYSRVRFDASDRYITTGNPDDSGRMTHRKALPVLSLSHRLSERETVYASVGRGFETPTLAELSYRPDGLGGLNHGLVPSVSTQFELGWRQRLTGEVKGQWSAAVFQSGTRDEIVSAGSSNGRTTYRNAAKTRRQGAELQADLRLSPQWQLRTAYTYLDASFRGASGPELAGKRLPGISRNQLWLALDYRPTPEWRLGLAAQHASRVFVNDNNSQSAPSFTVASASVAYGRQLGDWSLNAFARIDNLFDRAYVGSVIVNDGNSRFYEGAPGRNWSTGVSLSRSF